VKEILKTTGLSPDRVQMFHCSAAEGQKFQEEVTRISEIIEKLAGNPLKESPKKAKAKKGDSKKTKKAE